VSKKLKILTMGALVLLFMSCTTSLALKADFNVVTNGNNHLALDLQKRLMRIDPGKNSAFSPNSIYTALAMTWMGARGETKRQMARTLHYNLPQNDFHPLLKSLNNSLTANSDSQGCSLGIANALWGQDGYSFNQSFCAGIDKYYEGGFNPVNFATNSEGSRRTINQWVAAKTSGHIPELIGPNVLNPLSRLVLTNAIYFKGSWVKPFDIARTNQAVFTTAQGAKVSVPMMHQKGGFLYGEDRLGKYILLPYQGDKLAMVVVLPQDGLKTLCAGLTPEILTAALTAMRSCPVDLALPKFKIAAKYILNDCLAQMGMPDAFSESKADFSGMNAQGKKELYITDLIHQAVVEVDENGSEASGSTAVVVGTKSLSKKFAVDRPFLFMIRHQATGTILFMGAVNDPTLQ
jgi:serpin B